MTTTITRLSALWLSLTLCAASLASTNTADTREWAFRVYLDNSEIGSHTFSVTDVGNNREITTEAEFNVKFLFFNAYQYRHKNTERWGDGCLEAIESETDANGDLYSLTGTVTDEAFVMSKALDDARDEVTLPGCVTTFAYWDARFLEESRLLNTQTGDYVDVAAELVGEDLLTVRGAEIPTRHYRLTGQDLEIELWYSQDNEWLALESVTDGGRRLRYVLI
ncbi:MAG: DUF6134 family protein [Gammaproteobacteria bacterium]